MLVLKLMKKIFILVSFLVLLGSFIYINKYFFNKYPVEALHGGNIKEYFEKASYACEDFSLQLSYVDEEIGFGVSLPYFRLDYLKDKQRRLIDESSPQYSFSFSGGQGFPSQLHPTHFTIFENTLADDIEAHLFDINDDNNNWNVLVPQQFSIEEFRAVSSCLSENIDNLNASGSAITSIVYDDFIGFVPRAFFCANKQFILRPDEDSEYIYTSNAEDNNIPRIIGYIDEQQHFKLLDTSSMEIPSTVGESVISKEIKLQEEFQLIASSILKTCQTSDGEYFLDVYPL